MPEPKNTQRLPSVLQHTEDDIQLMLSAQCHIGTKNYDKQMSSYIYKRRADGINIINLGKTWEKIVLAARVIVTIDNPSDVCVISARPYGHRAVLKYASHTGAQPIAGRFTPGSFTNYITRSFKEPRLIIVTDPRQDHQAIREASYTNIPVIAFCDTDAPVKYVDIAIPTSNKSKHAIGLMWWMLCREVLRLRGTVTRHGEGAFAKMPDTFFFRDPEDEQETREEKEAEEGKPADPYAAEADPAQTDDLKKDEWAEGTTDWAAEPVAPTTQW